MYFTCLCSPHCMRRFSEQKISSKYTEVVVKPKVVSCFQNKSENTGKSKLTIKLL